MLHCKLSKFIPECTLTFCVAVSKSPNVSKMNIVASSYSRKDVPANCGSVLLLLYCITKVSVIMCFT